MALGWDYINKIITIPRDDLIFVDPVYELDTIWFINEVRADISNQTRIWIEDVYIRTPDVGPIVGTVYAGTIQLINGWRIQFDPDELYSVLLTGSNNDLWDIAGGKLVPQNVQVIPTNSAGLVINASITPQDVWEYVFSSGNKAELELLRARINAGNAFAVSASQD
jgi:hypothetical protein